MKILITLIFSSLLLIASSANAHQVKVLEKIFSEISIDEKLCIWSDDQNILNKFKQNNRFETVENIKNANIIVLKNKNSADKVSKNQLVFVLDYKLLHKIPKSFGALFWKKGRPNIVIIEPRATAQNIDISKSLAPYLEERVW